MTDKETRSAERTGKTPRLNALVQQLKREQADTRDSMESFYNIAEALELDLAEFEQIRDLCLQALVRATGMSMEAVKDAPLSCAIEHANRMAESAPSHEGQSVETIKTEIYDLFARYGSGDYTPTEDEKTILDAGLDEILLDIAPRVAAPSATVTSKPEEEFVEIGWVCVDGTPALKGSKPLDAGAKLYARHYDIPERP